MRLDAYYFGFESTGSDPIDRILSAVACAGKAYHGTDRWSDESDPLPAYEDFLRGKSCVDWIQNAAEDAAKDLAAARAEIARLTAELAAARQIADARREWLGTGDAAKSPPRTDTAAIAADMLACAEAWAPGAMLMGNVRADEIAAVCRELAAARAVPPDVEAAIKSTVDGAEEAGRCSALGHAYLITKAPFWTVPHLKAAIARAISDATESKSATVGGLLATAPDGVAETADGAQFRYIASKSPGVGRVEARSFRNAAWGAWSPSVIVAYYLRTPARPVPAHLADADPASRGPIGEG